MMPEVRSPDAPPGKRRANRLGVAAGCAGLVAQAVFMAGWAVAGTWQPPGYSPVRDTISDLMAKTAPHALVTLVIFMLAGVGTAFFALTGLRPALAPAGRVAAYAPWFLALSFLGLGSALSFVQIPCQSGVGCTLHQAMSGFGGTVDLTGGSLVALLAAVAPLPMARRMRNVAGWQRLAGPSALAGAVTFTCLLASALGPAAPVQGLLQRIAATVAVIWAAGLAANLIRVSSGGGIPPVGRPVDVPADTLGAGGAPDAEGTRVPGEHRPLGR